MTPRSLTKAGATRLPAGLKETADMLEKLDWQLLSLRVCLRNVGRPTEANALSADLQELAQAAKALARIVQVTGREGKKLCPHFAAALQRRQTSLQKKREAPVAAAAFPQFALLPAELRVMVWAAAAEPLPCLHLFHILEAARKHTRAEEKETICMRGILDRDRDPAGVLLLGDLGLWTACAESRRVVKREHARAHRRLLANSEASMCFQPYTYKKFDVRQDFGCRNICTLDITKHGRRMNRLNRAAFRYTRVASSVHRSCEAIRLAEHALRKEPAVQTQTQTQEKMGQTQSEKELAQQPPSAILQDLLRYLYALDGDLPQGAHDGPISEAALGLFRKDLRLRHLLDFGN